METIGIELTRLFIKVVQLGSFSKAANLLRIPKSTVSKSISRLEQETGTKLLIRSTRSQALTAAGRAYYETCLEPIQIIEEAQKSLYGSDSILSGNIKLTAPEDLGTHVIAPLIGDLCKKHPKLTFELEYTNSLVDLVKEGFDLAIRIGKLQESRLKTKRIGEITLIPVASPIYLNSHEKIIHPKQLTKHDCLSISSNSMSKIWQLKNKSETLEVTVRPRIESNQMTSLLKIALAGGGIALAPNFLCKNEIAEEKLVRILPAWKGVAMPVSFLSPISIASSARLKLISDQLFTAIQNALSDNS